MARRPSPRTRRGFSKLNSELVAVRGRGLRDIDTHRGSRKPLSGIEELTAAANSYTNDKLDLKRGERITSLIRDAVKIIKDERHKKRVTLLFGLYLSAYESATKLREHANMELSETYLSESARVYRDRQAFRSLEESIHRLSAIDVSSSERKDSDIQLRKDPWLSDVPALAERVREHLDKSGVRLSMVAVSKPPMPFMAPPDSPYFVGRRSELETLGMTISLGIPTVLHGLFGMGGVGKTALAARFCHLSRSTFTGGILWAQLDKSSTADILYAFAQAFGCGAEILQLGSIENKIAYIQSVVSGRQALVVLDNALSSDQLEPLIRAMGSCEIIVTTRRRNLAALRDALVIDVELLAPAEALDLLESIIGSERLELERSVAIEICEMTGYLPLAIRIIAERAKRSSAPLAIFAARLRERRALEELNYGTESTKETDVRVSFALSYHDLPTAQQEFFASLGAFGGVDFDSSAAAYVAELETSAAERYLEDLAGLSLVQPSATGRWRLHSLLREYAQAQMSDNVANDRVLSYYVSLAEKAEPAMRGPRQNEWLARLDIEISNIRAALGWAMVNGRIEFSARLLSALLWYWNTRGFDRQVRSCLDEILAHTVSLSREVQAKLLRTGCYMASDLGQFSNARKFAEDWLAVGQEIGDASSVAASLDRLGSIAWCQGRYNEAQQFLQESLRAWEALESKFGVATVLNLLGLVNSYQGNYSEGASFYQRALALWRKRKDEWGVAVTLSNLAENVRCTGDFDLAERYYLDGLTIRLRMRDRWGIANSFNNLGELMRARQNIELAADYYCQALPLAIQLDNNVAIATSLAGFAGLAAIRKEWTRAARLIGASEYLLEEASTVLGPANKADYGKYRSHVNLALGPAVFEEELSRGRMMPREEAVKLAALDIEEA